MQMITRSIFARSLSQKLMKRFSTQGHHNPRRNDEEIRGAAVPVSVWWDFESCSVPVNTSASIVAPSIVNAVRAIGNRGPIQITAFEDVLHKISSTNQEAELVPLKLLPCGCLIKSLLWHLHDWVSRNPPPAHVFLISGDEIYFARILHQLRMKNYNILLASAETTPFALCSASTLMWHWNSLLKGETLSGKLFNQPPDAYWYGHFKAFAVTEQSPCFGGDESSDFDEESFWKEMESFINSCQSLALTEPKSRDRLVQYLQEQGPPFLKSLSENELLDWVRSLIAKKLHDSLFRRFEQKRLGRTKCIQ